MNRFVPFLFWALLLLTTTQPAGMGQQSTKPSPGEILQDLSKQAHPAFEANVQFPMDLLDHRADETWNSRITYDGESKLHLGWLGIRYNEQETLVLENREQLLTPDRKRFHKWWIHGNESAFVDSGTSSLSEVIGGHGVRAQERVRQLVTVLFETQLLSDWVHREEAEVVHSDSSHGLRMKLGGAPENEKRVLVIQVDRDRSRVNAVRLIRKFSPSYQRPDRMEFELRVDAFHGSGPLPEKLRYVSPDGTEHPIQVSYQKMSENRSLRAEPAWASTVEERETSTNSNCPGNLFQIARGASFYRRSHFQKRLKVFGEQVDRMRSCYERRSSGPKNVSVPEEELMEAIRFSRDDTHTPSGSEGGGTPTAFQTFLRMIRLEDQERLNPERLKGISLRPFYSTPIQLLAFRSAVQSISSAKSFSKQLERIAGRHPLRVVRLFVREMEHRLRGKGDRDGVIQENGKEFLVSVQKEMETTLPSTILMARLYRELGYFEKADAAYAALSEGADMIPEVKGFIRTAQTDAVKSLKALGIQHVGTRELLYLAGMQVDEDNVSAARQTFQSFVDQYTSSELSLFVDDIQVIRTVFERFLKAGHEEVVRRFFRELVRREGGRFTGQSYLRPLVESVYGDTAEKLYILFRHLKNPQNVSSVMHLETAVYHAQSRIDRGEADRQDYVFLARAIPHLLSGESEGNDRFIEQIETGYDQFSSVPLLAERLGDLFWRKENRKKARDYYREAIQRRSSRLDEGPPGSPLPAVPPYGHPSRLLDDSSRTSIERLPLLIKFVLAVKREQRVGHAKQLLNKTVQQTGKRSSWTGFVRDPGIAANYERQYGAWGLYLLDASGQAVDLLQEGVKREHGRFPYGSFEQSSAHSLFRMRQYQEQETRASDVLRQASDDERTFQQPFRYRGSASQQYIQFLTSKNRTSDALDYLRRVARTEWRQMSAFTYASSATEQLANLLFEKDRIEEALSVQKYAFYRSLPEKPPYKSGTATYEFISNLKTHRHSIDALVVARELSTIYASDPQPLQEEIENLQSKVEDADLVDVFGKRFREASKVSVSERTRELVKELVEADPAERAEIEKSILNREDRVIPLLFKKWRNRTSEDVRSRLRSMIESRGWTYLRSKYERPDLLHP